MLYSTLVTLLPLASVVCASVVPVGAVVHSLEKRQSSTAGLLAGIFNLATAGCNSTCEQATQAFVACAALPSQASIAACACSSQTIGDVRSCSACIATDSQTTSANSTGVINAYNSYVDLCTSEGLASVTGTLAASASTAPLSSRTSISLPPSGSSSRSLNPSETRTMTYDPNASITSVAQVPSLAATVGSASASGSAGAGAGAASQSARPSSGAQRSSKLAGGLGLGLGGLVAGAAVLLF